jgi:hypothetical protein
MKDVRLECGCCLTYDGNMARPNILHFYACPNHSDLIDIAAVHLISILQLAPVLVNTNRRAVETIYVAE